MSKKSEPVITIPTDELPDGWSLASIADLVGSDGVFVDGDWVESKDQDPNGDVRLIQLADVGDGSYRDKSSRFLTQQKAIALNCTFLERGDVLIARMPDPLGRACIFPGDSKNAVTVVDVAVVRTGADSFNHRWLMHFVNAPAFRSAVASLQSGSTRKRISRKNLARIMLPVPPREKQDEIVAEIEKQFSRLDEAVTNLKRVKANLKRYKAAVLKAAVEGKLTEEWRQAHPDAEPASKLLDRILAERRTKWEEAELAKMEAKGKAPKNDKWKAKYKVPVEPALTELLELPQGWAWATWDQISNWVTYGFTRPMPHVGEGFPIITAKHVIDGKIEMADTHKTPAENYEALTDKDRPQPSDILITKDGTIGRAAIVPEHEGFCINQSVAVVWLRSCPIRREYLLAVIESELVQKPVREKARGVAIKHLSITDFARLPIPIPPMLEQAVIHEQVSEKLSVVASVEASVDVQERHANRLRQSILQMAFSAKLVEIQKNQTKSPAELISTSFTSG